MRAIALLPLLVLAACASTDMGARPPPGTVERVDLRRFAGNWYEIARLPNGFQDGRDRRCVAVTATYTPHSDGTLGVVNRCLNAAQGGRLVTAEGWARPATPDNSKLRVTFFWPFFGDYWIVGLAPDYRWAVVGTPDRNYLWILSRTPEMSAGDHSQALAIARREGFAVQLLVPTPQPAADAPVARSRRERLPPGRITKVNPFRA